MTNLIAIYAAVDEPAALTTLDIFLGALGQETPQNLPILARQLGQSQRLFQVPPEDAQVDLHHRYH